MDVSPFPYQGPLPPEQVSARDHLIADLIERVTERRVTALLGPRRYGKTSVLRRVAADLSAAATAVLWVDLYEVASVADLAIRLDQGMSQIEDVGSDTLRQMAAGASLNLGLIRFDLRAPTASRPDPIGLLHTQLELLTGLAKRVPLVAIFDEFSSIHRVDGAAGVLRTHLQHHYQEIGLLFAGSEPSMMASLFSDRAQPFYAQADLIEIERFQPLEVIEIVQQGFAATGRSAGPVPERIVHLAHGHPQRTMQLADAAWRLVPQSESATIETWELALTATRAAVGNGLERLFSSFAAREKDVLRIVASGESLFGSAAQLLNLPKGSAQHAKAALIDHGQIVDRGGKLEIVDPLLADWLRLRLDL